MPVDVKSLRICNWLDHFSEGRMTVNELNLYSNYGKSTINGWEYNEFQPVLISSDILEASGFTLEDKVWWCFPNGWDLFELLDNSPIEESYSLCNDKLVYGLPPIKWVHQLQNLIHSLTGEELNIKFP